MSDPQPPVTFLPAASRAPQPETENGHDHPHPHHEPPQAQPQPRPTIQRAPAAVDTRTPAPVIRPIEDLPIDPEVGKPYRPFHLGGEVFRCASKVPANAMLDIVSKQGLLADRDSDDLTAEQQREMLGIIGSMLSYVLWPQERERMEQRLLDPIDPVDLPDLVAAVQALWAEYNAATAVGKGQQDS